MLYLAASAQQTVAILDLDSPTTLATAYKQGFEEPVSFSAAVLNEWEKAPFSLIDVPITEIPFGEFDQPEYFSSREAQEKSIYTIGPIAQLKMPDGTFINLHWDFRQRTYSLDYQKHIGQNFATFKMPISHYIYDAATSKNNLKSSGGRLIRWGALHDLTITVPEGNRIVRIVLAPPTFGTEGGKYGMSAGAFNQYSFHATPLVKGTNDVPEEIGDTIFAGQNRFRNYRSAVIWTSDEISHRSVTIYHKSQLFASNLVSGSLVVTYEPDPTYIAPTELSRPLSINYTNKIKENTFLNNTRVSFKPEGEVADGTTLYFTTDGSDPALETNIMRIAVTDIDGYTYPFATKKSIRAVLQEPGKLPGPEATITLSPLEKTNYSTVSYLYLSTATDGDVAHITSTTRVAAVEQRGTVRTLTLIDAANPPRGIVVESDGVDFPASYTKGAVCEGLTFTIRHDADGRIYGDATEFASVWPDAEAATLSSLSPREQALPSAGSGWFVRYEYRTVAADGNFTSPAGERMRIVATSGGNDIAEWYGEERNAVECVAGPVDESGTRLMYLVRKEECPGVPQVTLDGRPVEGRSIRFSSPEAMVEVVRQSGSPTIIVTDYEGSTILHDDEYIRMISSAVLKFTATLNGMSQSCILTFTKVDADQTSTVDGYMQLAAEGSTTLRSTARLTAVWIGDNYFLAADADGKMMIFSTPDDAAIEPGTQIVECTSAPVYSASGLCMADISDFDDLFGHLENTVEVSTPQIIYPSEKIFTEDDVMNGIYTIADLRLRPVAGGGLAVNTSPLLRLDNSLLDITTYDPNALYRITATVAKLPDGSLRLLPLALEEEQPCATPVIAIDNGTEGFLQSATVTISATDGADIWYTTDGTDPSKSPGRLKYSEPFTITTTTTVTAYATARGMTPGPNATATFTRTSFIANRFSEIMSPTAPNAPASFEAEATVEAVSANHLILRDGNGMRIGVRFADGAPSYSPGDVISNFVITRSGDASTANLALADDFESTFSGPQGNVTVERPVDITADALTQSHAWRLVKLRAPLSSLRFDLAEFGRPEGWPADESTDHVFEITAIAVSKEGAMHLWPLEAADVTGTPPTILPADGELMFYPETTVAITHPDADATLSYSTDGGTTWTPYSSPFVISATTTIMARADRNGFETAYAQPLTLTLRSRSCAVVASPAINPDGSVTVSLSPANPEAEGTIYYTTDPTRPISPDPELIYTGPFTLRASATVRAIMVEDEKVAGDVLIQAITVSLLPPVEEPEEPDIPVDPGNPDTPDDPDTPDNPDTPDDPSAITRPHYSDGAVKAPAGSRIYDLSGRQCRFDSLRPGIYIVVTPEGRRTKIIVP